MNVALGEPTTPFLQTPGTGPNTAQQVREGVLSILRSSCASWNGVERRCDRRYPYPHLIQLTPVGDDGTTPNGDSIVVVGRHVSERGLDFYHREPLPGRRMIAAVECGPDRWVRLLVDVSWCRFKRQGWYESGGRFLKVVPSPLA